MRALREQLDSVPWVSRGFTSAVSAAFAKKLATLAGRPDAKVLTERNGADAIETALALARATTGRYKTISFYGAYHGRSAGALSVSGSYQHRQELGPLLPGAIHVPPFHRHAGSAPGATHESCARESLTAIGTVYRGVIPMFSPARTVGFSVPLVIDQRSLDECIDIIEEVIAAASMK